MKGEKRVRNLCMRVVNRCWYGKELERVGV